MFNILNSKQDDGHSTLPALTKFIPLGLLPLPKNEIETQGMVFPLCGGSTN